MSFFTLITGSSSGIGKALALECAGRGQNILLVALPGPGLERLMEKIIREFGVMADYLATDLTTENAPMGVFEWTRQKGYTVNILINNAGISFEGPFENCTTAFYERSIQLNIIALVSLTRLFLPEMKKLPRAWILNLGSAAAYFPIPYKVVYSASKKFVYVFSRALREELRQSSVSVSVMNPGPVITNRHTALSALKKGKLARMMHSRITTVARRGITGMFKGKPVIQTGAPSSALFILEKILPTPLKLKISSLIFK